MNRKYRKLTNKIIYKLLIYIIEIDTEEKNNNKIKPINIVLKEKSKSKMEIPEERIDDNADVISLKSLKTLGNINDNLYS